MFDGVQVTALVSTVQNVCFLSNNRGGCVQLSGDGDQWRQRTVSSSSPTICDYICGPNAEARGESGVGGESAEAGGGEIITSRESEEQQSRRRLSPPRVLQSGQRADY